MELGLKRVLRPHSVWKKRYFCTTQLCVVHSHSSGGVRSFPLDMFYPKVYIFDFWRKKYVSLDLFTDFFRSIKKSLYKIRTFWKILTWNFPKSRGKSRRFCWIKQFSVTKKSWNIFFRPKIKNIYLGVLEPSPQGHGGRRRQRHLGIFKFLGV